MCTYRRYPSYTIGRLVITLLTAILSGLTWWHEGKLSTDPDNPPTLANIQNILGVMYAGMSFMGTRCGFKIREPVPLLLPTSIMCDVRPLCLSQNES
jgi:hypothetical protein